MATRNDTVSAIEGVLGAAIPYFSIINSLYGVIEGLIARGKQTGELTDAQMSALDARANALFEAHSTPAPPPPGVTAGAGS
jgi:hypothetical protein